MKGKIMFLIIGILIGAIITAGGFLIYNKTVAKNSNQPEMMQMNENGTAPSDGNNAGEPPEKPSGDNGEEPPTKPDDSNTNTSTNTNT